MDNGVRRATEEGSSSRGIEPLGTSERAAQKSPWGAGTLLAVASFGGFAAAGIIAGINWRRMGRQNLMWPTIVVPIVAFIAWMLVPWPENQSLAEGITRPAAFALAVGLWQWQGGWHRAWKMLHPQAHRAGWQIPLLTVIAVNAIVVGLIFGGGLGTGAAVSHFSQGVELQEQGRFEEAIDEYTKAIELDPNYAMAYSNRAAAYLYKGQYDLVMADCNKAIELDPELAMAYNNRGAAYATKGELDQAIADFDKAIELAPELAMAYNNRGAAYATKGELDKAIADFDKAIELDPDYAKAYFGRGLTYYLKGEVAKAVSDLEKCIELSDDPIVVAAAQQVLDELRQ